MWSRPQLGKGGTQAHRCMGVGRELECRREWDVGAQGTGHREALCRLALAGPAPTDIPTVAGRQLWRDGKRVQPQRRVNCASHRLQANSFLSTGTHCMCRHMLHRTFVPRTTVPDSLMTANSTLTDPRSLPIGKITTDWQTRSAGDEELTTSEVQGARWLGRVKPQARRRSTRRPRHSVQPERLAGCRDRTRGSRRRGAWRVDPARWCRRVACLAVGRWAGCAACGGVGLGHRVWVHCAWGCAA